MTRNDDERIADILDACREIGSLVGRGRQAFDNDRAIQLALERLLEIVGEAANALAATTREGFAEIDWSGVTRLRIVLAHHYHRVDSELVWSMAAEEVPVLERQLTSSGS